MAAKLQCEICGGKLVGKPGGVFECEYCGMEYDTAWAKEKIQEIKGTVKVEGTVEVKGTVSVDTKANKENLLKRISICAEDGDFKQAIDLSEDLLKLDPECGEAYLWQTAAEFNCHSPEELLKQHLPKLEKAQRSSEWKNALRYLDTKQSNAWEQRIAEAIRYWTKEDPELKKRFSEIQPVQDLLYTCGEAVLGLQADGSVRVTYKKKESWIAEVSHWTGVKKLFVDSTYRYVFGLCWDGSILAACGKEETRELAKEVQSWADNPEMIVDMVVNGSFIACLFDDGEVCATKDGYDNYGVFYFGYACDWEDVERLYIVRANADNVSGEFRGRDISRRFESYIILGVTYDGHVRCSASCYDLELPRLERALGIEYWEKMKDVAKIDTIHNQILFRDGTLKKEHSLEAENGKWLDFTITDKGCIMEKRFNLPDECFVERNLVAHTDNYALRADGTLLCAKGKKKTVEVESWRNIVALQYVYPDGILGLREDGTVLLAWSGVPRSDYSVYGWKLFQSLETFNRERAKACDAGKKHRAKHQAMKAEAERKELLDSLNTEKTTLQTEHSNLKGLFTGKRRKEIETRLAEIERELKELS